MFLVDKYNNNLEVSYYISLLDKIIHNFDNYNLYYDNSDYIKNLNKDDFLGLMEELYYEKNRYINFQHLILYGPYGTSKEYIINKLLENIYGPYNIDVKEVEYIISGYSNIKTKVLIKQSKNHIIIEPNSNGFDKYLIQEIIHEYARSDVLNIFKQNKQFKIVIINKIDNLSYIAQASLRRTMEIYSNTCKFILVSDQLTKIIEPIRSRCILFRIALPTNIQITEAILHICKNENIKIKYKDLMNIINQSDNKITNAIWLLDIYKYNISYDDNWNCIIDDIVSLIFKTNNCKSNKLYKILLEIRNKFYILFITNIPTQLVIRKIMINMLKYITDINMKYAIINITSDYEQRLSMGTRHIIHIEAYIIKLIQYICAKKI
jgi:replication factor C subunit 3/5